MPAHSSKRFVRVQIHVTGTFTVPLHHRSRFGIHGYTFRMILLAPLISAFKMCIRDRVDTLEKAKAVPCVFNNWAVFYKGSFQTVNLLLDIAALKRIVKK